MSGTCTTDQVKNIKRAIIDHCGFEPGSDTQYESTFCNKQRDLIDPPHPYHHCAYDNFDPIGKNKAGSLTHCNIENYSLSANVFGETYPLKRTEYDREQIKKFNTYNIPDTLPIGHPKGWSSYTNCYK